jgi:hypothetical protein
MPLLRSTYDLCLAEAGLLQKDVDHWKVCFIEYMLNKLFICDFFTKYGHYILHERAML